MDTHIAVMARIKTAVTTTPMATLAPVESPLDGAADLAGLELVEEDGELVGGDDDIVVTVVEEEEMLMVLLVSDACHTSWIRGANSALLSMVT